MELVLFGKKMELITTATSQHKTHGSSSRHKSPPHCQHSYRHPSYCPKHTQVPMSDVVVVTFRTTLLLNALIGSPMAPLSHFHTVAPTPTCLLGWPCVGGRGITRIDDVNAAVVFGL